MIKTIYILLILIMVNMGIKAQESETYAEKLGWKKGDRVLILHIDDAGMSYDSNLGTIRALEEGMANSVSVMMPCPWVPGFVKYLKENPDVDAGLHLTVTSEWEDYRWGPLVGRSTAPGMVDEQGAMWRSTEQVVQNASADEVEKEIIAQIERARNMGFEPTHLDSHMGALFASPLFIEKYVKIGVQYQIPIMIPGGHNSALINQLSASAGQRIQGEGFGEGKEPTVPMEVLFAREVGKQVWDNGLPVLDDLHNTSYGWRLPEGIPATDENLQKMKTDQYIEELSQLKPGITMVIMHCTDPTEVFQHISGSGDTRKGDLLAMIDPRFKEFVEKEGFILTTWRELKEKRDRIK